MTDPHHDERLTKLLVAFEQIELEKIQRDLRAIIACTDEYVPAMAGEPNDEFLIHAADIREQATTLLTECGTVTTNDGDLLTRIKERFADLKGFIEYWFALRQPQVVVERVHIAL